MSTLPADVFSTHTVGASPAELTATTPLSDVLQAWDSGGPTFVEEPGTLALAGVHDAISGSTSYDTDVMEVAIGSTC